MSDPAKLHNLGLKLAEARREVIRSRTVVRIIRSAYRLDDLGASVEAIPAKFLMLVIGNMMCDCAAIFYCADFSQNTYKIVDSVGCSNSFEKNFIEISTKEYSFIVSKEKDVGIEDDIVCFMNAEKVLCVSDKNTGYAIAIGFYYNSTIDYYFDLNDQETMKDALAIYIDVLERRRTRRLLEQALQNAEAREAEISEVVSATTDRMLSIVKFVEDSVISLSDSILKANPEQTKNILSIYKSLENINDIIHITLETINEQSSYIIIEKEWVFLPDFVISVVRNAQQSCVQQDVDLRLRPSETRIYVRLDRIWMEMILNTLVAEALAYITGGGELFVEISQHEDNSVSVSIQGHSRLPILEPQNNGSISRTIRKSQVTASIRRLIEAHSANFVIDRPGSNSVCVYLYINKSECEER